MIVKDSEKEKIFIKEVIKAIKDINTSNLLDAISQKYSLLLCSVFRYYIGKKFENYQYHQAFKELVECKVQQGS